jgi:hypothetical protein
MSKNVFRLTESELVNLIKTVISEQVQIVTNHDRSFDYKKDGDKFYFKGKGKYAEKYPNWTLATKKEAIDAIRTKVFKMRPSSDLVPIEPIEPSQGSIIPLPDKPIKSETSGVEKENLDNVISCSGYGPSTPEFKFAKIISTKEGWIKNANNGKGSRSYRNNNPGNLVYSDDLKSLDPNVQIEKKLDGSKGKFASFSSPCLGTKALIELKIKKWSSGQMPAYGSAPGYTTGKIPTLKQFMYTYAPPNENNTEKYIKDIINSFNGKYTPNTLMSEIIKT